MQVVSGFNETKGDVYGCQIAVGAYPPFVPGVNHSRSVHGAQIGCFNIPDGDVYGLQIGVLNKCGESFEKAGCMCGLQVGIADFTGDMVGVQIGVGNIVRRVKGLQIGVVNWTETMECGLQIGLWNQIKNNGWATVLPIVNGHF